METNETAPGGYYRRVQYGGACLPAWEHVPVARAVKCANTPKGVHLFQYADHTTMNGNKVTYIVETRTGLSVGRGTTLTKARKAAALRMRLVGSARILEHLTYHEENDTPKRPPQAIVVPEKATQSEEGNT